MAGLDLSREAVLLCGLEILSNYFIFPLLVILLDLRRTTPDGGVVSFFLPAAKMVSNYYLNKFAILERLSRIPVIGKTPIATSPIPDPPKEDSESPFQVFFAGSNGHLL